MRQAGSRCLGPARHSRFLQEEWNAAGARDARPAENWVGGYAFASPRTPTWSTTCTRTARKASCWDRLTWGNLNGYILTPIRTTTSHFHAAREEELAGM